MTGELLLITFLIIEIMIVNGIVLGGSKTNLDSLHQNLICVSITSKIISDFKVQERPVSEPVSDLRILLKNQRSLCIE